MGLIRPTAQAPGADVGVPVSVRRPLPAPAPAPAAALAYEKSAPAGGAANSSPQVALNHVNQAARNTEESAWGGASRWVRGSMGQASASNPAGVVYGQNGVAWNSGGVQVTDAVLKPYAAYGAGSGNGSGAGSLLVVEGSAAGVGRSTAWLAPGGSLPNSAAPPYVALAQGGSETPTHAMPTGWVGAANRRG